MQRSNIRVKKSTSVLKDLGQSRSPGRNEREKKPVILNDRSFGQLIPVRRENGNKGTFGKVLIVAGSQNMAGAAILCARACFAAGCGMVMVLTDECNRIILQTAVPEALLATYDGEIDEEVAENAMEWANCILIGPGISTTDEAKRLLDFVMQHAGRMPIVLDADALNIISEDESRMRFAGKKAIVTPHVGEMARLVGLPVSEIQSHMTETAEAFAAHHGITVLLKDAVSVIASPGRKTVENHSGNCGMATAGSGDVLAGFITGLVAQGMTNPDAAIVGAYMHGRAGDMAAEEKTQYSMTASDIIDHIPDVFKLGLKQNR